MYIIALRDLSHITESLTEGNIIVCTKIRQDRGVKHCRIFDYVICERPLPNKTHQIKFKKIYQLKHSSILNLKF